MEIKHLIISGFGGKDITFDFEQINDTLTVATHGSEKLFKESLLNAIFGMTEENEAKLTESGAYILEFEYHDKEYRVQRIYNGKKSGVTVTSDDKQIEYDTYRDIVAKCLKRDADIFLKLGFASDGLVEELSEFGIDKILALINKVEDKINTSYEIHKDKELGLEEKLVHLSNFDDSEATGGRNALLEMDKGIKELEDAADDLSETLAVQAAAAANEATVVRTAERLIELEEVEPEMDRISDAIARSRKAKAILDLEAAYVRTDAAKPDFIKTDGDLALINAKVENLNQQIVRFADEQHKSEGEIIFYAEKLQEIRGNVHGLVEVTAQGATGDVESEVNDYYEEFQKAKESYAERLKAVEVERAALYEHIADMESRRNKISYPVAYRKAVIDAVTLEDQMTKQTQLAEKEEAFIKEIEEDIAKKQEEFDRLTAKAVDIEKAAAELLSQIVGDYDSKEARVNTENIERNKLYSNHIIVTDQMAETKAIDEKIAKLNAGLQDFEEKRSKLNDAKVEVEVHKAKLNKRLRQMENKYNERIAENLYAQQIESLSYGDRCPICDGFVVKKNAKLRFMKMDDVLADMDALRKAIEEDDAKIARILLKLGAYMSATASSEAYINSLTDTKNKKLSMAKELCRECGVETSGELTEKLRAAIDTQQKTNESIDFYHDLEGRLASILEAKSRVSFQIKKLTEIELTRHQKALEETKVAIRMAVEDYRPVMRIIGEHRGKDIISQLMIVDKELETLAEDLEAARKRLAATEKEREDINKTLAVFDGRDLPIGDNNESVNVAGLGAKVIARRLKAMTDEIAKYEEEYEKAKIRFVAAKRVVDNYSREKYALEKQLIQNNAVEGFRETGNRNELETDIKERLKDMGVTSTQELKDYVMSADDERALETIINEYRGELYTMRSAVDNLMNTMTEPEDYDDLRAQRSELRQLINSMYADRAMLKLSIETAERNDRQKTETERALKKVRANIRELEVIMGYIKDGKLDSAGLFVRMLQSASSTAYGMSKGAISLDYTEYGIQIVDNLNEAAVLDESAATPYQKMVRRLALLATVADVFDAILNSDTDAYLVLGRKEHNSAFAELAINYSRSRNLTIVADEGIKSSLVEVL